MSNNNGSNAHQGHQDFTADIAASALVDVVNPSDVGDSCGSNTPHVIHAVSVSQPMQTWSVIRDHVDFTTMDAALKNIVPGLPTCPDLPNANQAAADGSTNMNFVLQARNSAQEWLTAALTVPAVRNSAIMRQFLCYGANIVPPQFEGVGWINFNIDDQHEQQRQNPAPASYAAAVRGETQNNLDEMEMDEMFAFENENDDDDISNADEDGDSYDEGINEDDDASYLQGRYEPPEEHISQEEVMDFQKDIGEVEMVEDVGSLAQSLGASHLGRSLNLQKEMMSYKKGQQKMHEQQQQQGLPQGVNILTNNTENDMMERSASSGIGNAMENASDEPQAPKPHIKGLADSFYRTSPISAPKLDSFKMVKVIGKGSFGKVFLVREKKTAEMFALKVLKKDNIIKRNQVEHTRTERNVLGYVKHPFIVGLNMAFQSKDKLYFVLDFCAGGELFFHLGKVGKFAEPRAMFYAAEIALAISYVHNMDIVYRDLKPENVLLDSRGHVRLTDFGLSKEGISNSSSGANSFCGTPEYLAPEILNRQGHGRAVDWWSLGALLFEMLTGLPPFYCRDREKLFEKIKKANLEYPKYLSSKATILLKGLLTKDPRKRLGSGPNDAEEIKGMDFFGGLNWDKLMNGEIAPPWDPQINGSMDTSQFDNEFTNMPLNSPGTFQVSYWLWQLSTLQLDLT